MEFIPALIPFTQETKHEACNIISQTLAYVKYLILRNMSNHKKPSENKIAEEIERPEWDWIKRKSLD